MFNMLFRTLKRMIARGQVDGLEDRIDVFLAAKKISIEEYNELIDLIKAFNGENYEARRS